MSLSYDYLTRIIEPATAPEQRLAAIRGFAEELGWTPSYEFHHPLGLEAAQDHLVVEHGLEHAAVLSFLRAPFRPSDIDQESLRALLTLSYNNLVEWHLFVSDTQVRYVHNLSFPHFDRVHSFSRDHMAALTDRNFSELSSQNSVRRRVESCDNLLIHVISRWRRILKADFSGRLSNSDISVLMNAVIFARACEDYVALNSRRRGRLLADMALNYPDDTIDLAVFFRTALESLTIDISSTSVVNLNRLSVFDDFDRSTAYNMLIDFYRPSAAPFEFNFAFMSKHALSRIYERYVSLLEDDEDSSTQHSLFPVATVERAPSKSGSIYTPQFVAGFFARYLRDNTTPRAFRTMRTLDPACGSGIFLRTILELQCNPFVPSVTPQTINNAFQLAYGIDRDPNACEATYLSLALLHLVAIGRLPESLNVRQADAIALALQGDLAPASVDAIVINPPYIKLDNLSSEERRIYQEYLSTTDVSRTDSYIAFTKLCLTTIASGGFICLVLPQTFLLADNARSLRGEISRDFDVRCLVDLSAVPVFEDVGVYNVLLIIQKKIPGVLDKPRAQIVQCRDFVGVALQAALDGKSINTPYYSVFEISQDFFTKARWVLLRPQELQLTEKLGRLRPLSHYLAVRQGVVTGDDSIFIRKAAEIPSGEEAAYKPYLPDRRIFRYQVPGDVDQVIFYPTDGQRILTEEEVRTSFPETWSFLENHRERLQSRRTARTGNAIWWRPDRPRDPKVILGPKIVCPHLMLTPRFAVDSRGTYLVSRSPFVSALDEAEALTFLGFFCGVLNSSVVQWYISRHSFKYRAGYNRIEVPLLSHIPVPDPAGLRPEVLNRFLTLVDSAVQHGPSREMEEEIDDIVVDLYRLSKEDRKEILGEIDR